MRLLLTRWCGWLLSLLALLTLGAPLVPMHCCLAFAAQPSPTAVPDQKAPTSVRSDRYGDALPGSARMRCGTVRWQAGGWHPSFSPDGRTIILYDPFEIHTIDANTGKQLAQIRLQRFEKSEWGNNIKVALSSDCKTIATIESHPEKILCWEVASGKLLREFRAIGSAPRSFIWSPDGSMIAATDDKNKFYLWDAGTGAKHKLSDTDLGQGKHSLWMDFSPDSRLLAIAVEGQFIRVWDLRDSHMVHEFKVRPGTIGFTRDGKQVACLVDESNEIKFWNAETGKEDFSLRVTAKEAADHFEESPDGNLVAAKAGGRLLVWSLRERKLLHTIIGSASTWFEFSPDGKKLAGFNGRALSIWDAATGREVNPRPGHAAPVATVVFSPSGSLLASADRSIGNWLYERKLILWGAATGDQLCTIKVPDLCGIPFFSSDSNVLLTADSKRGIKMWDVRSGQELRLAIDRSWEEVGFHDTIVYRMSPDKKRLGALKHSHEKDGQSIMRFWLWDPTTSTLVVRRTLPDCYLGCFSHDCQSVALALRRNDNEEGRSLLRIQDTITGREQARLPTGTIWCMAFSADGRNLALSDDERGICIREIATGKERVRLATEGGRFVWSADARVLATRDFDHVYIWDGITGEEISRIHLPEKNVFSSGLAISPDSRTVAVGMDDTTILTWDLTLPLLHAGIAGKDLASKDLARLWTDLAGPDAGRAHRAIWTLIELPGKAVPFLKGRMNPVSEKDLQPIEQWIADLDSPSFSKRSTADMALRRWRFDAEPGLRSALEKKPSPEARRRLEALLARRFSDEASELLAQLRALEALEYIGNQEARQVLASLATGTARAWLTREANASLKRLAVTR